jgi:inner membrane protein
MDNVCHTLVGAACARTGIARPTRLSLATSMIAANLPDVDVLVFVTEMPAVAFRRGWTHGILAQAVLPALFAGLMLAIGRWVRRGSRAGEDPPALAPLLLLSYVGVWLHVFLDYLNNYGVRLLMPFSGRWFYGDTLFIVDPWLWLAFGAAFVAGRAGHVDRTRRWLIVAAAYILCMTLSARMARTIVQETWTREHGAPPRSLMVGPVPLNPFQKAVVVDAGREYRAGSFTWFSRRTTFSGGPTPKQDEHAAIVFARRDPRVGGILVWARFPFWTVEETPGGTRVTVRDMRFAAFESGPFSATTIVGRRSAVVSPTATLPGRR